jgi:hypothetical protein
MYVYADKKPFTCRETQRVIGRETGNPIPYSKDLAFHVMVEVKSAFSTDEPHLYDPKPLGSPSFDGELKRFICALAAYNDPRANGKIPISVLIANIHDKNYDEVLKKIRFKSLLMSFDGTLSEPDKDLEDIPGYYITDIAEIFNPRFWFFWEKPDPNDEKWAWEPIEPIDPDLMRKFEDAVYNVTPSSVEPVSPEEILLQVTGSGCISSKNTSSKVYLEKHNKSSNSFSSKPLTAKLVYVQKCPGDSRRASVLSVPHSNTIKWFEKQFSLIAADTKHSIFGLSDQEFSQRYLRFKNRHSHFLCRDIKKDGITKNRELVMATLRVLQRKYPKCQVFDYKDIYSNWYYYLAEDPSVLLNPPRGVGLGMSSAITTVIQSAILQVVLDELWEVEGYVEGTVSGIFYHDDATIGFDSEGTLLNYDSVETQMFQKLGLIKNLKKTFHATDFVLCEEYTRLNDKKHYQLNLLYAPFHATNIVQAKVMVQQLTLFETQFDLREFVPLYAHYWGYEFTKEETKLPFTLGGWVPSSYGGVDTSFFFYDDDEAVLHQSLLWASLHQTIDGILDRRELTDKSQYNSPLMQLYGPTLFTNGKDKALNYDIQIDVLKRKMSTFAREGLQSEAWGRLMMKRYNIFNKHMKRNRPLSVSKTYDFYCEEKGFCDVLPPPGLYPEPEIEDFKDDIGRETHSISPTANPTLSYLAYHNPNNHKLQNIEPSPIPPTVKGFHLNRMSNAQRKALVTGQDILVGTHLLMGREFIPIGDHYNFLSTKWIDPYTVASAWCAHTLEMRIPIPPIQKDSDWEALRNYRVSDYHLFMKHSKYAGAFRTCLNKLGWYRMSNPILLTDEAWEMIDEELGEICSKPTFIPDADIDFSHVFATIRDEVECLADDLKVNNASTIIRDFYSNGCQTPSDRTMNTQEDEEFWAMFGSGDHLSDLDTDRGSEGSPSESNTSPIILYDSEGEYTSSDNSRGPLEEDHG